MLQQESSFVMANYSPLKSPTLPHLELMAALAATHLEKFITDSLQLCNNSIFIWTDSQVVLYWINSKKSLPQFVSSKVSEIHNTLPSASWRFCSTIGNPADLLTLMTNYSPPWSGFMAHPDNLWPE